MAETRNLRCKGENWKDRDVKGSYTRDAGGFHGVVFKSQDRTISEPTNKESKKWRGWGTALKPASEHWILIQKPVSEHNIAANIKRYSTGAINIDGTRTPVTGEKIPSASNLNFKGGDAALWDFSKRSESSSYSQHPKGRFPTNVVLTKDADLAKNLNAQSGRKSVDVSTYFFNVEPESPFIYCKKPNSSERGANNSPSVNVDGYFVDRWLQLHEVRFDGGKPIYHGATSIPAHRL